MMENIFTILLPGIVVTAAGMLIVWFAARRYRRELGLKKSEREKTPDMTFIISAFQDVTKQLKEKERELERLKSLAEQRADTVESYTENILQCISNGVITFDDSGRATTINRAAEEMLKTSGKSEIGKTCSEIFNSDDICFFVREALENRVPSRRLETSILRKGERIWLGFNTALLSDKQGRSLGVILSFSDLTEVKRLQEQIELKERLTALGEMSAGIAHELRNPMAVIAGYLNLLAKKQDSEGRDIIRYISAEIEGMNRIIGDLLAFARPASLNRAQVNIRELLETCIDAIKQMLKPDLKIAMKVDGEDAVISLDEGLIRQAIGNIINNAVESMPEGGTLAIAAESAKDYVITISDTGEGIAAEHLKKIFLPFFTTKEKGIGMGLALAHKIITSHGGRIEVESAEGKGTTFRIILPK